MKFPLSNLSEAILIKRCLKDDDTAWEEFFRRYNHTMDQSIVRTMVVNGYKNPSPEDEIFWEIKGQIIEKIYLEKRIREIKDPSKIRSWLIKSCQNETLGWLRKKSGLGRAYQRFVEDHTLSIHQPLANQGNRPLSDLLSYGWGKDEELVELVRKVKDSIEELDEKYRLALKLLIIFYEPLSERDIAEIARLRNIDKKSIEREINDLIEHLVAKEERVVKKEARKAILWGYISRLESHINYLKSCPEPNLPEIHKKEAELQKKINQRETLLKESSRPIVPSYKDIASILGWPEDKARALNLLFFRAREILQKKINPMTS